MEGRHMLEVFIVEENVWHLLGFSVVYVFNLIEERF